MVLDAAEGQAILIDADDRRDDADLLVAGLEQATLLDMGFEIAAVAAVLELDAGRMLQPGGLQRIAHLRAVVAMAGGVDVGVCDAADEGLAADHAAPMALLVGPRGDVDGEVRRVGILGERPRHFEPVDHAHHAIEPAAARLGVGVRAHQEPRAGLGTAADHVAHAVDHRLQPRLLHAPGEPTATLDILRREMRAMNAGLIAAEVGDAAACRTPCPITHPSRRIAARCSSG